jgi:mono/diheme cytochrome c family protein
MKRVIILMILLLSFAGCAMDQTPPEAPAATVPASTSPSGGMGMGRGMGRQSGMMARHSAPIPEEYAGLANPIAADEASLQRGAELFVAHCATCHGDGAMGDGPTAATLDPAPVPIAHTSQMMGDSYLFYRISEGGAMAPFNSAMPAWKEVLAEEDRWHVLNYVQALGSGAATPVPSSGGEALDPGFQATRQADMLSAAISQGILSADEAVTFGEVHSAVEALRGSMGPMDGMQGDMAAMEAHMLGELVAAGTITQAQADAFSDIHTRLIDAGLME